MTGRGKPHPKIVVACARELAGFVWAIATEQPMRCTRVDTFERGVAGGPSQKENPRYTYAAPSKREPRSLDRGSSRRTPVMRYPTRECQSDPPSLPQGRPPPDARTKKPPQLF